MKKQYTLNGENQSWSPAGMRKQHVMSLPHSSRVSSAIMNTLSTEFCMFSCPMLIWLSSGFIIFLPPPIDMLVGWIGYLKMPLGVNECVVLQIQRTPDWTMWLLKMNDWLDFMVFTTFSVKELFFCCSWKIWLELPVWKYVAQIFFHRYLFKMIVFCVANLLNY